MHEGPKRRGRPPKMQDEPQVTHSEPVVTVTTSNAAQAYANRVWAGQSVSLPYGERWYRVKMALEGQGMSMEGVVLS